MNVVLPAMMVDAVQTILIALTGWGQEEHYRRAREAGFAHHLVKPVDITKLQDLLASLQQPIE